MEFRHNFIFPLNFEFNLGALLLFIASFIALVYTLKMEMTCLYVASLNLSQNCDRKCLLAKLIVFWRFHKLIEISKFERVGAFTLRHGSVIVMFLLHIPERYTILIDVVFYNPSRQSSRLTIIKVASKKAFVTLL